MALSPDELIQGIFRPACHIADILRPLGSNPDEYEAANYFPSVNKQMRTIKRTSEQLGQQDLSDDLREPIELIVNTCEDTRSQCTSIGDVCVFIAGRTKALDEAGKRGELAAKNGGSIPKPRTLADSDKQVLGSTDYRTVRWSGDTFTFTPTQAACVKVLIENSVQGTPSIGEQTILEHAESSQGRLSNVFQNGNHPAWGTMIVSGPTKGTFRIAAPG